MWRRRERAQEFFVCEICKSTGVQRRGVWDYCPRGHNYVGQRAEGGEGR
jgi:hypothetical protein